MNLTTSYAMKESPLHTSGKMATRLGVQGWQISKLAQRGKIPFLVAGVYRVYAEADEPAIRAALVEAGYLKPGK